MRSLLFTLVLIAAFGTTARAQTAGQLLARQWDSRHGLPLNSVADLVQTRDGYLWVLTNRTLSRFDGHTFTQILPPQAGTSDRATRHLTEDTDGSLYVSVEDVGIVRYHRGRVDTLHNPAPGNGLLLMRRVGSEIWALDEQNAYRVTPERMHPLEEEPLPARPALTDFLRDTQGRVWVADATGLHAWTDGQQVASFPIRTDESFQPQALYESPTGEIWVGSLDGLYAVRGGRLQPHPELVNGAWVRDIRETAQGHVLVSTSQGLWRFAGGTFTTAARTHLSVVDGNTALVDAARNVWYATISAGLLRLQRAPFYQPVDHFRPEAIFGRLALLRTRDGTLWSGSTCQGLLALRPDGTTQRYTQRDGLVNTCVWSLLEDRSGRLWVGTWGGGLYWMQGNRLERVPGFDPKGTHLALFEDRAGTIWAGADGVGVYRYHAGGIERLGTAEGLAGDLPRTFYERRDGSVWIGMQQGISRYQRGTLTPVRDSLLRGVSVRAFYEDADGVLWIGTYGKGLLRMRGTQVQQALTMATGMPDDVVSSIVERGGQLWMSTNRGIARVNRVALAAWLDGTSDQLPPVRIFDEADGMPNRETNGGFMPALLEHPDGSLWYPTLEGVAAIRPEVLGAVNYQPPLYLEGAWVEGRRLPLEEAAALRAGRGRYRFRYAALDYAAPEHVRYFVRLEGFDDAWVPVANRREVSYTSLPPGRYTFHVRAVTRDGVETRLEEPFALRIRPQMYQTWWFWLLLAFALVAAGYGLYRWRVRVLRRRQRYLQHLVQQRTAELARQNEALVAANDFKRRMIGVASHDLRGPLSGIVGLANVIAERTDDLEIRETAQLIESSGTHVLAIVIDLLQAAVFEGEMPELNRKPLDLAELARVVVQREQAPAHAKAQTLRLVAEPCCHAAVDERWMNQAITNLVGNAIKFTPEGGAIVVTVQRSGAHVRLSVRDTGPGIQPDEQERLFMPFHRGSAHPTKGEVSTGLGLSIVRDIVERHGGRVFCTSTPGEGATFTVELDACEAPPARSKGASVLPA